MVVVVNIIVFVIVIVLFCFTLNQCKLGRYINRHKEQQFFIKRFEDASKKGEKEDDEVKETKKEYSEDDDAQSLINIR